MKYPQYSIPIPHVSFALPDMREKMKELYNILYILQKTEAFKTNKRFEYFFSFRHNYDLLEQINYVLLKQNMEVLISLDKPTNDITDEAIKYSIDTSANSKKKDDYISELQKILELEKKIQDEHKLQNILLKEKYDKLSKDFQNISKEYRLFQKECEELNKARSNQINDLEKTISEVRQKYTK